MPTLSDKITNKINGIIAFLGSRKHKEAYIKSFSSNASSCINEFIQQEFKNEQQIESALKNLSDWARRDIFIISYGEEDYPEKLKNIYDPPPLLFILGNPENIKKLNSSLAIVGSRKADPFGCKTAEEFGEFIAAKGICIVSGLAIGVDTFSHKGAIKTDAELPTIAVLGNGLNSIYPSGNARLAKDLLDKGGLIISQFHPEERPFAHNFLDRNRIIAGLSDATLVIQAPQRSGSLVTARHALESGRDVLVVPGAINDPRYAGSNKLIKEGAHMICAKNDLLDFFPGYDKSTENILAGLTIDKQKIVKKLQSEKSVHIDQLQESYSDQSKLAGILLELELEGIIRQEPGNFVSLVC